MRRNSPLSVSLFTCVVLLCPFCVSAGVPTMERGQTICVRVMDQTGHAYFEGDLMVELYHGDDREFVDSIGYPVRKNDIITKLPFVNWEVRAGGTPPLGGEEITFTPPGVGTYWVCVTTGQFVDVPEDDPGLAGSSPKKGDLRCDGRGMYEIIDEPRPVPADKTYEGTMTIAAWHLTKRYYVLTPRWVLTYVQPSEKVDNVLVVVNRVDPAHFAALNKSSLEWGVPIVLEKELFKGRELTAFGKRLMDAKSAGTIAGTVLVEAANDFDNLLSANTAAEITKNLAEDKLITLAFGATTTATGVGLVVAIVEPMAVGAIEQAQIETYSTSDDFDVSLGAAGASGQRSFFLANHGEPLYDVWVYQENYYGAENGWISKDSLTRRQDVPTGGRIQQTINPRGHGELFVGYSVKPLPAAAPDLVIPHAYRLDQNPNEGKLDIVFCIDTTGSMADDIEQVKKNSTATIGAISDYCSSNNISFQIGLVTYQDHTDAKQFAGKPEAAWLRAWPLTANASTIVNDIQAITIKNLGAGGDEPEDLYAAQMCAMDARGDWQDRPVSMGWREGAAKILIPISDAPPHEPDFEGRTLQKVGDRAASLDPAHCYPLILPKAGSAYFDPAVRAMKRIADATGGEMIRVESAEKLPHVMVDTIKLAVRRHKEEVWRKSNPPYLLYGTLAGLGLLAMAAIAVGVVAQRRSLARRKSLAAASRSSIDPTLTGESYVRPPNEPPHPTRGENQ